MKTPDAGAGSQLCETWQARFMVVYVLHQDLNQWHCCTVCATPDTQIKEPGIVQRMHIPIYADYQSDSEMNQLALGDSTETLWKQAANINGFYETELLRWLPPCATVSFSRFDDENGKRYLILAGHAEQCELGPARSTLAEIRKRCNQITVNPAGPDWQAESVSLLAIELFALESGRQDQWPWQALSQLQRQIESACRQIGAEWLALPDGCLFVWHANKTSAVAQLARLALQVQTALAKLSQTNTGLCFRICLVNGKLNRIRGPAGQTEPHFWRYQGSAWNLARALLRRTPTGHILVWQRLEKVLRQDFKINPYKSWRQKNSGTKWETCLLQGLA